MTSLFHMLALKCIGFLFEGTQVYSRPSTSCPEKGKMGAPSWTGYPHPPLMQLSKKKRNISSFLDFYFVKESRLNMHGAWVIWFKKKEYYGFNSRREKVDLLGINLSSFNFEAEP